MKLTQEYPSQEAFENCTGYSLEVHMQLDMVLCLWLRFITVINIVRNSNKVAQLNDMGMGGI